MPVERWRDPSVSPEHRGRSASPERNGSAGPSKKPKFTTTDIYRRQIEKLFDNPEKEIQLPAGPKEKSVRAPVEMMKNVQGSSSGAGSGEFHVYKQARRREYERLKIMSDKQKDLDDQAEFARRQALRDAAADAKTAKNRAKRQKRKQGKKGARDDSEGAAGGAADGKRKLAGGGVGVVFRKPGEESEEDEDEDEAVGPTTDAATASEEVVQPVVIEETKILIHDDD